MKEGKPCGFLNQSRNEVEPVSPGTLNPEPSQTCGVFGFYLFGFLVSLVEVGWRLERRDCLRVEGGLEGSLRSMSPSLIISTTSTWYRVWQITTLDDYSLSQPGWGSCSASAEVWKRGEGKIHKGIFHSVCL